MNFVETFKEGKEGKNFGLPTGLLSLDKAINGIQRKSIYGIAAAPKCGKTTLTDFSYVISPYLYMKENPEIEIEWKYFSFEIDRVRKEFKYAAYFLKHDYKVNSYTHNGKEYQITPNYLMGKVKDDDGNIIIVQPEHEEMLKEIYTNRLIDIFGKYDSMGKKVKTDKDGKPVHQGYVDFIEQRENPTGLRNYLLSYARDNGEFIREEYHTIRKGKKEKASRIIGYKPNNPNKYVIIVTDHIRKLNLERGFTMKQNVDKWIEYQVELRNWCGFTFVDIVHLNRNISSVERIKYNRDTLYPTGEDVKDTGNLSEECDYLITLFNPNDEKYNIDNHFGLTLRNPNGGMKYPNYRSVHLVESRDTECPLHLQTEMFGNNNYFKVLENKEDG